MKDKFKNLPLRNGIGVVVLNKDNKVSFFSDFGQLDYVKIVSYEIGSGN